MQQDQNINIFLNCYKHCQETLFNYCLLAGGKHTSASHVKSMIDCIESCQIAANFINRNSLNSNLVIKICAEICKDCAISCQMIADSRMDECAEICLNCAETCLKLIKN